MIQNNNPVNLLALTPCCVDYYPQIKKSFVGGNSLNAATMWKKLEPDSNISVITCLGNDENGKRVVDFLSKKGIYISRVYFKKGKTATNKLRVDENGERFGIEGAWQGGVYEDFILSDHDWDFVTKQDIVAMPANNPNFSVMIGKKHPDQVLVVDYLDVENGLRMERTVEFSDIAFIAARPDILSTYQELALKKKKLIVVTLGAGGSYAYNKEEMFYQPAVTVSKVIDTTGCGDAYQAAFTLSYYRTRDIQKSMLAGATAASDILQAWGGVGDVE